jgi:hypothetical protein
MSDELRWLQATGYRRQPETIPAARYRQQVLVALSRRWRNRCVFVLAALCVASTSAAQASLSGIFANPAQSDAPIKAAIEAGIAKMNFVVRSVARGRLKDVNSPYKRVQIEETSDAIQVTFDARKPVRTPLDGSTIKWTREDGQVFDASAVLKDGQLIQTFKNDEGQRINTFRLAADAKTLTLAVELTSPQLPAPVKYQLTFERSGT